ncbi:MAG: electron transport complex subunit RsxC [bacterium]
MQLPSFKGGIHPPHHKSETEHKAIVTCSIPEKIVLPLSQHIGVPCKPLVEAGQRVKAGQKIAESEAFISAPIHASVSGVIESIAPRPHFTGAEITSITIIPDKKQESIVFQGIANPEKEPVERLKSIVKEAGIVGMGGAAFPTFVKLSPPKDKAIDSLVINACECESFLTCDHRVMLENTDDFLKGVHLVMKIIEAKTAYIGIESNKPDAIETVQKAVNGLALNSIRVIGLQTKYPQGCEKQLIKAVLNREVPLRKLPSEVGAVVQNVGTILAIYEAIKYGKPLIERVLTVTGAGIKNPQNVMAKLGTPIQHLISFCGGWKEGFPGKIVIGGPMTGFALSNLDTSIVKGTSGIVVFPQNMVPDPDQYLPCLKCGKCAESCPMFLVPNMIGHFSEKGRYRDADECGALDCMECGSCAFVCPSRRPMIKFIRQAKAQIMAQKKKAMVRG